jgi:hypothetical protein
VLLTTACPARLLGDQGEEDPLAYAWSCRWPLAAARYAAPELPIRIAAATEVAEGSGSTTAAGAALVANVPVGTGTLGALAGGAASPSVVLASGGVGVVEASGVLQAVLEQIRAATGGAGARGAAMWKVGRLPHPRNGTFGGGRLAVFHLSLRAGDPAGMAATVSLVLRAAATSSRTAEAARG